MRLSEGLIYIYISVILLTNVLLLLVAYDSDEWYGLDETNDDTFIKKVINRFYYTCTTYSAIEDR